MWLFISYSSEERGQSAVLPDANLFGKKVQEAKVGGLRKFGGLNPPQNRTIPRRQRIDPAQQLGLKLSI
jgi:hypothetical protein